MHYVLSTTWGPTDITRAALPFAFAATALAAGDTVFLMLFHDSVTVAVNGAHEKMVPFGPPSKFAEVFAHPNAKVMVCKPCAEARGITDAMLVKNAVFGGMGDFYKEVARPDVKVVSL
jgi:predicted peroxiredoxin